ncbi:MAG: tRNA (N(6)-L-threonylcarbamoyladenosine(37)-C(2))-methylthiotransferase MtaB [Pseudomonadota bacterium]
MKRVAFITLGCKANWVDGEELAAVCRRAGLAVVPFADEADAYVVNTCTVTAVADQQSRQLLRRARRQNPGALVVATGCLGEVDASAIEAIPEVDRVFGTSDRGEMLEYLFERLGFEIGMVSLRGAAATKQSLGVKEIASLPSVARNDSNEFFQSRARAFLKIQDGCDRHCAYCIVPRARGLARSVHAGEIVDSCIALSRHHREIVLTGIDIGQYRDEECGDLPGLLERLLSTDGLPRIRISSIHPTVVDGRLLRFLSSPGKMCRHVHLSIQSCSDTVLKRMGRNYSADDVARAVSSLVDAVPGIAVTCDLIAGFPGESEGDHRSTVSLLSSLPLAGLHVFPYSLRLGTRAAGMDGQVAPGERRMRAAEIRTIGAEARRRFLDSFIGEALDVIVTSSEPDADGAVSAFSDNAISIALPADIIGYGDMGRAIITGASGLKAKGKWDSHQMKRRSSSASKSGSAINSSAGSI